MSGVTVIGSYITGEIPEPWQHDFDDATGAALNLSGYQVRVTYIIGGGAQVVRTGTLVDAGTTGKAEYAWVAADLAVAGLMEGEMWVGNGVNRYARSFTMTIDEARGGPAPNI